MSDNNPQTTSLSLSEKALFDIASFPVLDIAVGLKNMHADTALFTDIVKTMLEKDLPLEKRAYKQAYAEKDWETLEKLVHKMKGGSIYTGLVQLQHACDYFEVYYQSGQKPLLEKLYQQIMHTIDRSQQALQTWLEAS
ncbi:MAG: Hpt domain-containing protein [Gammaproteobacteria bacterium]|nr:Hpt domain-containing protein [Gammaproteobacteria bacterium]